MDTVENAKRFRGEREYESLQRKILIEMECHEIEENHF